MNKKQLAEIAQRELSLVCRSLGISEPDREYTFFPGRRWRFDFAFLVERIAVEVEGGIWVNGAHSRGKHFLSDCEKYNTATREGWQVYRFGTNMVKDGTLGAFMLGVLENRITRSGVEPPGRVEVKIEGMG